MSTATIRLDDSLRERIARVAGAMEQTPHSFMVQALTEKVAEAEWRLALHEEALGRERALRAGEPAIEWNEVKDWVRQRLDQQTAEPIKPKTPARR